MNRTVKVPGGVLHRVLEAINGFRTRFGHWPSKVEMPSEMVAFVSTVSLTPLGFFLLQSKLDIVINREGLVLAIGSDGDEVFDYGEEGWQQEHEHDAAAWLGLDLG